MPFRETSYGRMIAATLVLIVFIAIAIISYSIAVIPLEITIDALQDITEEQGSDLGMENPQDVSDQMGMFPYFLAFGLALFIGLCFLWYFVYAHKMEYE